MRLATGPGHRDAAQRPMRINQRGAVEIQRHLLGAIVHRHRLDVEPHHRLIAAGAEEQVADGGRPLELRRGRRATPAARHRQPPAPARWRPRYRRTAASCVVKNVSSNPFGGEQAGKIVQRDVVGRRTGERIPARHRLLAQRRRTTRRVERLRRALLRAAAAQRVAAARQHLNPALHRLRRARRLGQQQLRRVVAARRHRRALRRCWQDEPVAAAGRSSASAACRSALRGPCRHRRSAARSGFRPPCRAGRPPTRLAEHILQPGTAAPAAAPAAACTARPHRRRDQAAAQWSA